MCYMEHYQFQSEYMFFLKSYMTKNVPNQDLLISPSTYRIDSYTRYYMPFVKDQFRSINTVILFDDQRFILICHMDINIFVWKTTTCFRSSLGRAFVS